MAGSVNKVTLVGNLGKDPEVRKMQSGDSVVSFSVATSESWRDKNTGERKEKTEWHNVVIFNERLAKVAEQYLKKGMKVYVEGALQTRKWTDQSRRGPLHDGNCSAAIPRRIADAGFQGRGRRARLWRWRRRFRPLNASGVKLQLRQPRPGSCGFWRRRELLARSG